MTVLPPHKMLQMDCNLQDAAYHCRQHSVHLLAAARRFEVHGWMFNVPFHDALHFFRLAQQRVPHSTMQVEPSAFAPLGLGPDVVTPSRAINFANLLETARKRVLLLAESPPRFPSLVISADRLEPQGDFAKAQAQYLKPNAAQVERLVKVSAVHSLYCLICH